MYIDKVPSLSHLKCKSGSSSMHGKTNQTAGDNQQYLTVYCISYLDLTIDQLDGELVEEQLVVMRRRSNIAKRN
jgi:hypothetical protein